LVFGLGPRDRFDAGAAFAAGVAVAKRLAGKPRDSVALVVPEASDSDGAAVASALTEGAIVGTRGIDLHKSEPARHPFGELILAASAGLEEAVRRGETVGEAINLARDQARSPRAGFWKKLFSPGTGDSARMGSAHDGAPDVLSEMESLPDGRSSAEKQFLAREQVDLMWKAVAKLTERQRAIFLLRFVEEMSLDEIAGITQLRISSVKTHLWRATAADSPGRPSPSPPRPAAAGSAAPARQRPGRGPPWVLASRRLVDRERTGPPR